jgi:hypothetical protein
MFNGGFEEAASGSADLPEDDPEVFTWLVEWLYRNSSEILSVEDHSFEKVRFYCFASKYRIAPLTDVIMDSIQLAYNKTETYPNLDTVAYVFRNCGGKYGLRRYMVQIFVVIFIAYVEEDDVIDVSSWKTDAMLDLFTENEDLRLDIWRSMRSSHLANLDDPVFEAPSCDFHEHEVRRTMPTSGEVDLLRASSPQSQGLL